MSIDRRARLWGLLAVEAGRHRQPISVAAACQAAVRVLGISGATAAAVGPGGVHISVFATDVLGRRLEDLQSTLGQGPSLRSHADGAPVLASDLEPGDARWPLFGSGAVEMGVRAFFAFPMRSAGVPVGVFAAHRKAAGGLTSLQFDDALVLADVMTVLLLAPEIHGGPDFIDEALASDHHVEVYQATGMVSVHLGVSLPDALARLRGYAFVHARSISEVARDIVRGRLRLDESGR